MSQLLAGPASSRETARPRPARDTLLAGFLFGLVCLASAGYALMVRGLEIRTGSMEPTLEPGDLVLAERFSLASGRSLRGAVVCLRDPEAPSRVLVKRVVAVGGDAVALRGRRLLRNQARVSEPYARYRSEGDQDLPPVGVSPGELIVLGDHRDLSRDSREFGAVPTASILGRVVLRLWPPGRVGWVK